MQDNVKLWSCGNPECRESEHYFGTEKMWQELIRTRKALDVAKNSLVKCSERQGCELLDTINDGLRQITALEQIESITKGGKGE